MNWIWFRRMRKKTGRQFFSLSVLELKLDLTNTTTIKIRSSKVPTISNTLLNLLGHFKHSFEAYDFEKPCLQSAQRMPQYSLAHYPWEFFSLSSLLKHAEGLMHQRNSSVLFELLQYPARGYISDPPRHTETKFLHFRHCVGSVGDVRRQQPSPHTLHLPFWINSSPTLQGSIVMLMLTQLIGASPLFQVSPGIKTSMPAVSNNISIISDQQQFIHTLG
ncbi:hypothetical protein FGO68_gene17537 [Halteria grandinella]|uniref:Uncharacterized protein n=1 Tax=Halteria grandinella TaxID=5974 RepID=A0A8J8TB82_HALGN|nr:hypothetical protein FGO68_gene17537 [Halteria grandinella]